VPCRIIGGPLRLNRGVSFLPRIVCGTNSSRNPDIRRLWIPLQARPWQLPTGAFAVGFGSKVQVPPSKNKKVEKKSYSCQRNDLPQKASLQCCRFSIKSCMLPLLGGRLSVRSRKTEIKYQNEKPAPFNQVQGRL